MDKDYIGIQNLSGIRKTFSFSAFHNGNFKKENHVDNIKHKHEFRVIVRCKAKKLNDENVVIDFRFVEELKDKLQGQYLNKLFNEKAVTTEYIAKYICENLPLCFLCEVFELNDKKQKYIPGDEENMAWYYRKLEDY